MIKSTFLPYINCIKLDLAYLKYNFKFADLEMWNLVEFYTHLFNRADGPDTSTLPTFSKNFTLHPSHFTFPFLSSLQEALAETRFRLDSLHLVFVQSQGDFTLLNSPFF